MTPQTEFNKALKAASLFAGEDKPGLHVAHFHFYHPDGYEIVGTDGTRLVVIAISAPHSCPIGTRVSVPLAMIKELLEMFPADPDAEITLAMWDGQLLVTNGVSTHTIRGPAGVDYPPYREVINSALPVADTFYLNAKILAATLKDCAPLGKRKHPVVKMTSSTNQQAIIFRFELDSDLETIIQLDALIMPVSGVTL